MSIDFLGLVLVFFTFGLLGQLVFYVWSFMSIKFLSLVLFSYTFGSLGELLFYISLFMSLNYEVSWFGAIFLYIWLGGHKRNCSNLVIIVLLHVYCRYQLTVLELLAQSRAERQGTKQMECQLLEIHAPNGVDLSRNTEYASQAALWGIEVSSFFVYIWLS